MNSQSDIIFKEFLKKSNLQLYKEYTNLCYAYNINLRPVSIIIKDIQSSLGYWCPQTRSITIATDLVNNHSWNIVIEVLKHEMAHQYVSEIMCSNDGHKHDFQKACHLLRVKSWARKSTIILQNIDHRQDNHLDETEKKLIRWTTKLLALRSSSNEKESFSALEKVKRLNQKYNIQQLIKKKDVDHNTLIINHKRRRVEHFQVLIGNILINHFMVKIIYSSIYNSKKFHEEKTIEIIGTSTNIEIAEYVYWFLYNQIRFFWNDYKNKKKLKGVRTKNNFYQGILDGFDRQLRLTRKEETNKKDMQTKENSLIKLKGEKELIAYLHYKYPKLSTTHRYALTRLDSCYHEGQKIGYQLTLKKGLKNQKPYSIRLLNSLAQPKES